MKKTILFLISFFFMFNSTHAITLTCPEIASPNEKIICQIEETEYIGLTTNYNFNNNFTYNYLTNQTWKKYYAKNDGFSIGNVTNEDTLQATLELTVSSNIKVNQDYQVELTNIEAVDKNYQNIKLDNIKSNNIKILSNINTLSKLKVDNETITPKFDSNINEYELETYNDSITIAATPTDAHSKVTGDIGNKKLEYGSNVFTITITSARGESRNYYIYATRNIKKNNDITLKQLTISPGKIDFDKNKFTYIIDVDYNTETINIEAIPTNNKSKVTIDKPTKLLVGKNIITITVTAEDGTIGKYSIIVNRKHKLSSDTSIKTLNVKGYNLNFNKDISDYQLEIKNENKLQIEVILNDNKSKYEIIGNNNLTNNSIITIKVTAEDKTTKEYKIKIIKPENIKENEVNKPSKEELKDEVVNDDITSNDKPSTNQEETNNIFESIEVTPIIIFIILIIIIIILTVKLIKDKKLKK